MAVGSSHKRGERLQLAATAVRRRLSVGARPLWLTSILLVLLTWPISFGYPGTGLDFSWGSGLYMTIHDGKHFGTEVVFTYGPLGFLAWPQLWFGWLGVLAILYFCAIYVTFTATLVWSLSRTVGLFGAALITFISYSAIGFLGELPLLLAVGLSFAAMRANRPPAAMTLLVVGGGLLCAIEPLVKLSVGPPAVLVVLLGLVGARANRRQWGAFAAIAVGGFLAAWFLSGQGLGNLWDYAVNGAQVISGYNEAMGYDAAKTWEAVAIVTFALGLVALIHRAMFRDSRARLLATALTAVVAYVVFKYGTTQFARGGPPAVALSTLFAVFMMAPWPHRRAGAFVAATAVLGAIVLHSFPAPANLDVLSKLTTFKETAELAVRPGLRQQRIDSIRASLRSSLALPPHVLAAVQGKRVAIEPWEISVAWAYQLDWQPLPVFQNYTAYTPKLDRLNAAAIEDPNGPQVLLRQMPSGDIPLGGLPGFGGRQPVWDPPEQSVAGVCNFVPTLTEGTWQVLSRIPNRCGPPKLIATRSGEPGEAIDVPQASNRNEFVILRLQGAEIEGLERLGSLFWRPQERHAVLDHGRYGYRLVPGTTGDGLIVSVDRSLDRGLDFPELPVIKNISIEGASGPLRFDFYRVKMRLVRLIPVRHPTVAAG